MTVDTQDSKVQYIGNGTARSFAVPYKVIDADHLKLYLYLANKETELTGGYVVNGLGSGSVSVTLGEPLAVGAKLTIVREVPLLQPTDLQNGGDFNADVLESSLDYLEMQIQQNSEAIDRAVKLIVSSNESSDAFGEEIIQAHAETLEAAGRAEKAAGTATAAASSAKESADRAAALVDPASLASGVFNVRKPFVVESDIKSGNALNLPGYYFPTRDVLWLSYNGTVCSPRKGSVEILGEFQYEEIGDDPNEPSNRVNVFFDVQAGDVFDMWVVSSAVGANIDAITALAEQSTVNAEQAELYAASALAQAGRAEDAAGRAVEIVDEAVGQATAEARDQADRAKAEADRAHSFTEQLPDVNQALDGQVLVARNVEGAMQAGYENAPSAGVDRLDETLTLALATGEAFTVPLYIVGSGKLQIFYDGVICAPGPAGMYQEVGSGGKQSTSITFNESLPAGADITAIAAS